MNTTLNITLAYAPTANNQLLELLEVPQSTTASTALKLSNMVALYPEILDLELGVFGAKVTADHLLKPNDRLEVYRPLMLDPMKQRKKRVQQIKNP